MSPSTEPRTVRLVILLLGAVSILLVGGLVALALLEKPVPEGLMTLAGTTVGALAAVLVSTRSGSSDPVEVTTAPGDVVATKPAGFVDDEPL